VFVSSAKLAAAVKFRVYLGLYLGFYVWAYLGFMCGLIWGFIWGLSGALAGALAGAPSGASSVGHCLGFYPETFFCRGGKMYDALPVTNAPNADVPVCCIGLALFELLFSKCIILRYC
jgi:hypothetical protein